MIRYFRRYEKWIFWGIVIVILPTFSITGIMLSTCGQREQPPEGELYGKEVQAEDFARVKMRLAEYQKLMGGGGERGVENEEVWNHLAFLHQADVAGIEVSDQELAAQIERIIREIEAVPAARERFLKEAGGITDSNWQRQIFGSFLEQEAKKVVFKPDDYYKTLEQARVAPGDFERTLREKMRIGRLDEFVQRSAKADPAKVYDLYEEEYHKRKAAYVTFTADAYPLEEAAVPEGEIKKYYERHPDRFREPRKVAIEWVAVPAAAFAGEVATPTAAEIETRYETLKARYRIEAPLAPTGTAAEGETATAEAERYRPLSEVGDEIAAEILGERRLELAKKKAEALRAEALAALTAGKPVTLSALAAENGATYGQSGLVEPLDLIDRKEIRFWNLLNAVDKLKPGGPESLSEVAVHDDKTAAFFMRLVERRDARVPPFDEVATKVRESYFRGLDDELQKYHLSHADRYKTPAQVTLEYVHVPFARFARAVPDDVTGTARAAELHKRAEAVLDEVREAATTPTSEGKLRDLETVALDKGVEHGRATVERSGKDLPAEVRSTEIATRLGGAVDKTGDLSPVFENEAKTGLFAYVVKALKPEARRSFAEAKDQVRKDVLAEHAYERARDAADAFAKEVASKPAEFREIAAREHLAVLETPFIGRTDKVERLPDSTNLVGGLFRLEAVGETGGPANDFEHRLSAVYRYTAKEPADPAGFAEKEKELESQAEWAARRDYLLDWEQTVLLEARSVDEAVLKEVYGLKYGPDGLAEVEAAQIYVAADPETIKTHLEEKARKDAEAALADFHVGARFDDLARRRSQDQTTRRRGGDLGFFRRGGELPLFGRGPMPKNFEDAAFALKPGEVSEPVKTSLGWHLIQVTERRGDEVRARHILFKSERGVDDNGDPLPLDPETRRLAMEKALEKAKKAEARLGAGESFAAVAKDLSDEPGSGEKRAYAYETAFDRAVFAGKPGEVSDVLTIEDGTHHLLFEEEYGTRVGQGRFSVRPRLVRHIVETGEAGKRDLEKVREALALKRHALETEATGRAGAVRFSLYEFRKAFEAYAKEASKAPSGARGGRVGIFREDPDLLKWGPAFRDKLYSLQDGQVSPIFEGREGYHLVKVIDRVKKPFSEARKDVAASLLEGLDF